MRTEGLFDAANHRGQIARLEVVFLLAALHAREIEDVVDEPREPPGLGGDDLQIRALLRGVGNAAFGEQFGKHADGRERRLQFVRDIADEIGLLPGELQFRVQAPDDEPAADADGEHEHRNEQAEREPRGARRFRELRRINQIRRDLPMRQRIADFGGDKRAFPIGLEFGR